MQTIASIPFAIRSTPCGIALGSNLGNRVENLIRAARMIIDLVPGVRLTAAAGVYETAPVDCRPDAAAFLNTVIEIETDTGPRDLLAVLRRIERELGREDVREKNAPRPIDLDILYVGDRIIADDSLVIPHPRMHLRRFVLQPLADIRPDLKLRGQCNTIRQLLDALEDDPAAVTLVRRDWLDAPV